MESPSEELALNLIQRQVGRLSYYIDPISAMPEESSVNTTMTGMVPFGGTAPGEVSLKCLSISPLESFVGSSTDILLGPRPFSRQPAASYYRIWCPLRILFCGPSLRLTTTPSMTKTCPNCSLVMNEVFDSLYLKGFARPRAWKTSLSRATTIRLSTKQNRRPKPIRQEVPSKTPPAASRLRSRRQDTRAKRRRSRYLERLRHGRNFGLFLEPCLNPRT